MDALLKSVGDLGAYQKLMIMLIGNLSALSAMCIYASVFTAAESQFKCKYKISDTSNGTLDTWKELTDEETCKIWKEMNLTSYQCAFDETYYGKTIITEWNLVCDRYVLTSISQTVHMVGSLCSLFSGFFGDHFGRRKSTLFFSFLLFVTLLLAQTLLSMPSNMNISHRYLIYTTAQFIIGMLVNCCYSTSYVLLLELTTARYRTLLSNIYSYIYVLGELFVLIGYYYSRDWHVLSWITVLVAFVSFILAWIFMPESPQWLISTERYEEAYKVLLEMATVNKRKQIFTAEYAYNGSNESSVFSSLISKNESESEMLVNSPKTIETKSFVEKTSPKKSDTLRSIFYPRKTLKKTMLLVYIWNSLMLLYYGTSLGITAINVIDPYLMFLLSCVAEIVGCMLCHVNDIFGRRKTFSGFLIVSSVMYFLVALIPHDETEHATITLQELFIVSFVLVGKAMISGAYNISYIFTSELYETPVRNTALLFLICVGGIGSFVAPQINWLRTAVFKPLPYIIYCINAFLSCIFVLLLPETKDADIK